MGHSSADLSRVPFETSKEISLHVWNAVLLLLTRMVCIMYMDITEYIQIRLMFRLSVTYKFPKVSVVTPHSHMNDASCPFPSLLSFFLFPTIVLTDPRCILIFRRQ